METKIHIQNLKCGGCATTITSKLSEIDTISNIIVSNEEDTVSFIYQEETDLNRVKETLAKIGYPELGHNNNLTTKAKSYISCAMGKMQS
ncbi:heavy-metal-associated domain-containing protein [Flavobacterium sp.]|uniref:heavy-metal-associated domain-containing protein n=1 Tax=Flavobacterium sp. TaxID=239 RepID=UPI003D0B479F